MKNIFKKTLHNSNISKSLEENSTLPEASADTTLNDLSEQFQHTEDILKNQETPLVSKKWDKPIKIFGTFALATFLVAAISTPAKIVPDTTLAARNALETKISTSLLVGAVLLAEDENIGQQDYTITHFLSQTETKIWVWDYAAEDGDYVQINANGTPITDPFLIKNKPKEFTVPSVGDIQIKGIKDGGGGITYAIRYELNGTNYFNGAPEGDFNTYTLIKE